MNLGGSWKRRVVNVQPSLVLFICFLRLWCAWIILPSQWLSRHKEHYLIVARIRNDICFYTGKGACCSTESSVFNAEIVLSTSALMNEFCNMVLFNFYNLVIVQQIKIFCQKPGLGKIMWALHPALLDSSTFYIFSVWKMTASWWKRLIPIGEKHFYGLFAVCLTARKNFKSGI